MIVTRWNMTDDLKRTGAVIAGVFACDCEISQTPEAAPVLRVRVPDEPALALVTVSVAVRTC
jgi:hypothetical protein